MAVAGAHRRRGLAGRLLAVALAEAAGRQVRAMFLEVAENNDPARLLYEKHGFVVSGLRKDYYRQTDGSYTDALVMSYEFA